VRVLFDTQGQRVDPVEIDLRVERDVNVEAASRGQPPQAVQRAA
jgi:hypothetical protein